MQFYREDAHYLERTAPWIERVGLQRVKDEIVDDAEKRKVYAERFYVAQSVAQDDPWKERVDGGEKHEFMPLKEIRG